MFVQPDICNGCGYCVSACPFGVIDRREDDGRAWKCTLCYDRLDAGMTPACAKACPTESIQFGDLDELRARAATACASCTRPASRRPTSTATVRTRSRAPTDCNAFFLLVDRPEVYNLPPDPVAPRKTIAPVVAFDGGCVCCRVCRDRRQWRRPSLTATVRPSGAGRRWGSGAQPPQVHERRHLLRRAGSQGAGVEVVHPCVLRRRRYRRRVVDARRGGSQTCPGLRRRCRRLSLVAISVGTAALIADLGRPSRFANMLRVFRPTSPMSMGSWLLAAYGPAAGAAAVLPDKLADPAGVVAGIAGLPLTGYTGVLTAATAVPAWQEAGRSPTGAVHCIRRRRRGVAARPRRSRRPGGRGASPVRHRRQRSASWPPRPRSNAKSAPYRPSLDRTRKADQALLWRLAHGCTTISLLLSLPRKRARRREQVGALAGIAGSFLVKVAVMEAGKASADDPRATFHLQRARNSDSLDNR